MKNFKKIVSLIIAISMVTTCVMSLAAENSGLVEAPNQHLTSAEPLAPKDNLVPDAKEIPSIFYDDVDGHWAESSIKMLTAGCYVQGMGDGTFMPEQNVTRAEFVTMAVNALRLEKKSFDGCASDISADDWYADIIETAKINGLLAEELFDDGKFYPESDISREDAFLIAVKAAEMSNAESDAAAIGIIDEGEISDYAKDGVYKAVNFGLLKGYPDGTVKPHDTLVRAEATEIIVRVLELTDRLAIYVDPESGNDANDGKKDSPVASIDAARKLVKENNQDMTNHLFVFLKGGEYFIDKEIKMDASESGSNGYNIVYTSYDGKAQLNTAKKFSDFELHDKDLNIYRTYVGDTKSRQVYINGVKATRARSVGELTNCELVKEYGFICDDTFLADYKNIKDLELVMYSYWTQPRCHITDVQIEDGRAKLIAHPATWESGIKDNAPWVTPHYYENAYELLDLPGEWYIDSSDGYLYYIPRDFEEPSTMVATVPVGERMLTIEGTLEQPVHNITFDGLEFAYTTWMFPSREEGYNDRQNNAIDNRLLETAVYVERGRYIDFKNNKFFALGATALQMFYSIQECDIIGNEFADISASAFSLGNGPGDDYDTEVKPTEYKYYTINNRFNNNYVHEVAIDYGASAAVSATYPKYTQFNHNEITDCKYSGFHLSYGWVNYTETSEKKGTGLYKVEMNHNFIQDSMNSKLQDGGAMYTCGPTGGTYENMNDWSYNYLKNQRNAYGPIYPDSGSTFWNVTNNVIDYSDVDLFKFEGRTKPIKPRWVHIHTNDTRYITLRDNYSTTDVELFVSKYCNYEAPTVVKDGNWPDEAKKIIDESGLEAEYLKKYPEPVSGFNINTDEIAANTGDTAKIDVKAYGRKDYIPTEDEYYIYYLSGDKNVAEVDKNGVVTLKSPGMTKIFVNMYANGVVKTKEVDVICDDEFSKVDIGKIDLVKGYVTEVATSGLSKFKRELEIDSVEYTIADEKIAKYQDGKFVGLEVGETTVDAVYASGSYTYHTTMPLKVYNYSVEGTENMESTKLSSDFFDPNNWEEQTAQKADDGVSVTGSGSFYKKEKLKSGLYSFDMVIDNPNSWPSLTLRGSDPTHTYNTGNCYFIGFNKGYVELQRFNKGKRTYFMGVDALEPIDGPGVPNNGQVLEYGKKYSVTVGSITEDNGVRIILTIDGKNIINYLDTAEGYLKDEGYFGVYVGNGTFTFSPYTGK